MIFRINAETHKYIDIEFKQRDYVSIRRAGDCPEEQANAALWGGWVASMTEEVVFEIDGGDWQMRIDALISALDDMPVIDEPGEVQAFEICVTRLVDNGETLRAELGVKDHALPDGLRQKCGMKKDPDLYWSGWPAWYTGKREYLYGGWFWEIEVETHKGKDLRLTSKGPKNEN